MKPFQRYLLGLSLALSLVATALASVALYDVRHASRPVTISVSSPGEMTNAQARRVALTKWSELEQAEVDAITAAVRKAPAQPNASLKVFCFDEAKCGDLASSLENAFESAHVSVEVRYTSAMIPPGFVVSSKALRDTLGDAADRLGATVDPTPEPGDYITIGEKPRS